MSNIKDHSRETKTLTTIIEKPLIQLLVKKMPSKITPDILTAIGLFGALLTGLGYYLSNYNAIYLWLSSFGLIVNWFGDSLDGSLARYRHIERPKYGFFIDHSIDSVTMIVIAIGAGLSPYARFDYVLLALIGYLLMSILVYLNIFVTGVFKISFYNLGPTEMRLLIILLNTAVFFFGVGQFQIKGIEFTIFDLTAVLLAVILFLIFLISIIVIARRLNHEEKK
ncbi:MAG: CDP-alcohol phosphatidyltransferase [Candidatus Neomarinimicrobiota bacterium]|nr:MAG: CDP-alcohol phosphatidyltransferase [Candidatus Neomarinimicrobiota bacterium]